MTFWCTGSKRKQSYLQHDKNWRGALCCWFSCTVICFTSILNLCCHLAWNFDLQRWRAWEKPAVISMQFPENASWGGCRFYFQISHNWEEDSLQESKSSSSILCAESTLFSYCTCIKSTPDQPCCSDYVENTFVVCLITCYWHGFWYHVCTRFKPFSGWESTVCDDLGSL